MRRSTRSFLANTALLLVSLVLSAGAFLVFDHVYTAAGRRRIAARKVQPGKVDSCFAYDAFRTHGLKPNCDSDFSWGSDTYDLSTNSLAFRDEKVRTVPLSDPRPRIVLLGDSFTESKTSWSSSYAGKLAARFPQYEILNGGVTSYSPSNYLNIVRDLLKAHVEFDEVIVFIDISDTQDEAAYYHDVGSSGAVVGPQGEVRDPPAFYFRLSNELRNNFRLSYALLGRLERFWVRHGFYTLATSTPGNVFDQDRAAWTYRKVPDDRPYSVGFAPLGVAGGVEKEKAKMTLLLQAAAAHNIAVSVVVYPWPPQVLHDTVDSRQVTAWRDWCAGKCKRFISVFPAFFADKNRCSRFEPGCWYMKDFTFGDVHFNDTGNTLVADAVGESLSHDPPRKQYSAE